MSLFKYVPPETCVKIIENRTLRFTPLDELNDPFECLPDCRVVDSEEWRTSTIAQLRARFPDVGEDEHTRRYAAAAPGAKKQLLDGLMQKVASELRILCLSNRPPDHPEALLMWAHYATHTGFVLEFDENHTWISAHQRSAALRRDSGPVKYDQKRTTTGNISLPDGIHFTKSEHWAHEGEFRLVRFAGDTDFVSDNIEGLVKIDPKLIRSITFGLKAPVCEKTRAVITALDSSSDWSHITRKKASLHVDEFRLETVTM